MRNRPAIGNLESAQASSSLRPARVAPAGCVGHWYRGQPNHGLAKVVALACLTVAVVALAIPPPARGGLINPSFEEPVLGPGIHFPASIPGWQTTDSAFEVWNNFPGAFDGDQFVELNAFIAGTLFQSVSGISAGTQVGFEFAHRARSNNSETMKLEITDLGGDNALGGGDDTVLFSDTFVGNTAFWQFHDSSALSPIVALGNDVRFAYSAVGGGSVGNFLDAADFGVGVGGAPTTPVPEPTSLAIWSLVGLAGASFGWRKRRRKG